MLASPGKFCPARQLLVRYSQASSCYTAGVSAIYWLVVVSCSTAGKQSGVTCGGLLRSGLMIFDAVSRCDDVMLLCEL